MQQPNCSKTKMFTSPSWWCCHPTWAAEESSRYFTNFQLCPLDLLFASALRYSIITNVELPNRENRYQAVALNYIMIQNHIAVIFLYWEWSFLHHNFFIFLQKKNVYRNDFNDKCLASVSGVLTGNRIVHHLTVKYTKVSNSITCSDRFCPVDCSFKVIHSWHTPMPDRACLWRLMTTVYSSLSEMRLQHGRKWKSDCDSCVGLVIKDSFEG